MVPKYKTIGFGYDPADVYMHFLVDIPADLKADVRVYERVRWDSGVDQTSDMDNCKVILKRKKWQAVRNAAEKELNRSLKKNGLLIGKFKQGTTVKFHDATFHNDDEGAPIIVIHYDFSNEGKESVNPSVAIQQEAFQDGTKLEFAAVTDSSVYGKNSSKLQIEPGDSLKDCQTAYVLISSAPVEFELHAKNNANQKYVLVFDVEDASSVGFDESLESSTKTFTYKGKNFTYDVGGKSYKTSMGTVDIESFSVNNIRATTFNDLELDYEIVGVVEEEDSLVLSLKCYDSDGFLIDTSSLYGSVRAGEKFKIDNSITVPGKTAKVELAAG